MSRQLPEGADGDGGGSGGAGGGKKFRGPLALNRGAEAVSTSDAEPPRQIPTSAAGIGMLVVEPDEQHAKALAETCQSIGYRVTTVASGEEALDVVANAPASAQGPSGRASGSGSPFELILCDVELPGIPVRSRAAPPSRRAPVRL